MKVLHFIWSANFGGIEKIAIDLAFEQIRSGHVEATILIGCNKGQFLHVIKEKNIPHIIAGIKNGYHLSWGLISDLTDKIKEFDIIHIHTFNLPVMIAAIRSGVKIIYTVHGNFNYGKKVRVSDRINNFLKSYFLNNHVDFITFNSEWSQKEAISKFNIKSRLNFSIVKNGIDLNSLQNSAAKESVFQEFHLNSKFVVGTVSRFNKSKKLERLIEAFALFSKGKNDTILLLVGDGIERSELMRLVQTSHIENITLFTGYKSNVGPFEECMNVCVFPFENEAFGLVVLEAFALGKPVIIFNDSGGMKEIFPSEFDNDIVNNTKELANRLEYYYNQRAVTDLSLIEKRKIIASDYTLSQMGDTYLKCYNNVLTNN